MTEQSHRIGVDVSRVYRGDRGIPIYTQNILKQFGTIAEKSDFTLLHYPEYPPESSFGLVNPKLAEIPFSGEYIPWLRILQEQVIYPEFQSTLDLDVLWHPQNHGQYQTPVGYVVTLHDIFQMTRPELAQALDVADYDKKVLANMRAKSIVGADAVITVSQFSKGEILANTRVKPENIHVIPNGVDHASFYPGERDEVVAAKYDLPERYVLTVGSYAPHKNLQTLIDAFTSSELSEAGYELVMVGPKDGAVYVTNGPDIEDYRNRAATSDKITMLPSVPFKDLTAIYRGADIFAITSLCEGFGFPPLEAMASGVPVVSSNTTSLPEVCADAVLYSDPMDVDTFAAHLNNIAFDDTLRKDLVSRGIAQASKFSWETTARQTLKILQEVSNKRKGIYE